MLQFSPIRQSFRVLRQPHFLTVCFCVQADSSDVTPLLVLLGATAGGPDTLVGCAYLFLPLRYFKRPFSLTLRLLVSCTPLSFAAIAGGGSCTAQPVCCTNNHFVCCPDSYLTHIG